ncbi:MAG: hypothetical protein QOJ09_1583 [Actinomycetota bacterium]|nr:hypothetical protein [Actinomycetota bacterium]
MGKLVGVLRAAVALMFVVSLIGLATVAGDSATHVAASATRLKQAAPTSTTTVTSVPQSEAVVVEQTTTVAPPSTTALPTTVAPKAVTRATTTQPPATTTTTEDPSPHFTLSSTSGDGHVTGRGTGCFGVTHDGGIELAHANGDPFMFVNATADPAGVWVVTFVIAAAPGETVTLRPQCVRNGGSSYDRLLYPQVTYTLT